MTPVTGEYWAFTSITRPGFYVNKKLWKDPPFSMGKSTISMAMASIAFCMFTRGYWLISNLRKRWII
jgi:hypothetical protein